MKQRTYSEIRSSYLKSIEWLQKLRQPEAALRAKTYLKMMDTLYNWRDQ